MKQKLNKENLFSFQYKIKATKKDFLLIMEAYRRKHFLGEDYKFLGLGTPSHYKSKLFTASFGNEVPKCNNWYKLTSEGERVMELIENNFILPKSYKEKQQVNEMLFDL